MGQTRQERSQTRSIDTNTLLLLLPLLLSLLLPHVAVSMGAPAATWRCCDFMEAVMVLWLHFLFCCYYAELDFVVVNIYCFVPVLGLSRASENFCLF